MRDVERRNNRVKEQGGEDPTGAECQRNACKEGDRMSSRERTRETETSQRDRELRWCGRKGLQIRTVGGLWLEERMLPKITRNNEGKMLKAYDQVLYCIAKQHPAKHVALVQEQTQKNRTE